MEIRQGKEEKFVPELYVVPASASKAEVFAALKNRIAALQTTYPGLAVKESSTEARIVIPDRYRVSHEAHFAQVTNQFFGYLKSPGTLPAWEKPNMLVKYFISTRGVEMSRLAWLPPIASRQYLLPLAFALLFIVQGLWSVHTRRSSGR